jgi:hypothetical protein
MSRWLKAHPTGVAHPARSRHSFARVSHDSLVYTSEHLNLDLADTTCVVPCRDWEDSSPRYIDPFWHFIEQS